MQLLGSTRRDVQELGLADKVNHQDGGVDPLGHTMKVKLFIEITCLPQTSNNVGGLDRPGVFDETLIGEFVDNQPAVE